MGICKPNSHRVPGGKLILSPRIVSSSEFEYNVNGLSVLSLERSHRPEHRVHTRAPRLPEPDSPHSVSRPLPASPGAQWDDYISGEAIIHDTTHCSSDIAADP